MKVIFRTNLDLPHFETWPTEIACRPIPGDLVRSSSDLELRVVTVTFNHDGSMTAELHLPPNRFENIKHFMEWYKDRQKRREDKEYYDQQKRYDATAHPEQRNKGKFPK